MGADKCTFAAKEVNYLGHRVTEEGLLPDSSLLAAIREIPPPKTATEVRSFLGLAAYYRRYVKNFAAIAAPLHALTRKDAVFHWSKECQTAFDRLKTLLTTSPITAFPDFGQAFCLYTDASTAGLGGPWDTLSVDIVGPLPADRRHEFLIMFVDCYSRYAILVPASNHTASTVSDALLRHVVPYFGTPRRLLSDRGREFVGEVWGKLTRSLGIQRLLTSPYHPEGNSINERSHWTINNMLRARLLDGTPSRTWVDKIPGIMLALNAMAHEPHGFLASMIATGREPTLPPDLESNACVSPSLDDPAAYVDALKQRLSMTHQQMAPLPAPAATNPYCEESLIFVPTTPPELTNKLAPRWKGPFVVKRVPNPYQVVYEDGSAWQTIHVNHAKPAKLPAVGFPAPYPHLNLLDQLLGRPTSRGVFRGLSLSNLLLLLLNQPPLPGAPLLLPHHQNPHHPLLRLPQASG